MEGWVPIFFLMVVLKVPVGLLLYIVWWAFRAETIPEETPEAGGEDRRFRREPKRPRGPRRGPHAPDSLPVPRGPHEGRARTFTPPATARAASARGAGRGSAEPAERP